MQEYQYIYRKNFTLVVIFLILITSAMAGAFFLAYNLTSKYVENEFASQKIDVLEETVKPYNDFFQNKIPEISFYQGYLDSAQTSKYIDTIFRKFRFVERVIFYDAEISNHKIPDGIRVNNFSMGPKSVYQFGRDISRDSILLYKNDRPDSLFILKTGDEFNKMAIKFSGFIELADTAQALNDDDRFSVFYSIRSNRITFMNIPRREEIKVYKDLMYKKRPSSPVYEMDMLTFYLNPLKLEIINSHPELYQYISIKPLVYESLENDSGFMENDLPLSGPFSDYKLYFSSGKDFLRKEVNSRFRPIAAGLFIIYFVLVLIAYLIFRNLNINSKLFKLQYDFINNLTHEFKTPVSVIKIAGNNIRSASKLSDRERIHYGKILDEEADKLNDLMNRLLSFAQIENKAIKLKPESINLEVFCQNMIDSYQLKYPGFDIECDIKDVEYFNSDPVLLGSIFQNLIDNAFKYSSPDNKVLRIIIQKVKNRIVFKFSDQGIGIPEKDIRNIFKKFYRVQNQYNQQGSVGLGLAFCAELIKFMNGTITIKSVVGKGTEFRIELPYEI
ncbi:MAG: two-component sensor histidine kinase [Sphingobacteriales bacterium 17-39-43]|uniref:sensor histidine kinase n=1 Tax=Daejeonella sp. TaxID=2805397 RepID=UPI000BC74341|nr:HAMP domain-containing sensor histidine kinase [Daejeonella sp.]OYZ31075.1 MAG: two-component sensor histidine kinase [Sphingobacteriales bacterium 16-39-50]OZA23916.1 MAG: two-component sensor histidine kinase [Sphingobacteriales bacterium 17-39-43]HQT23330.1 HAMP domain-containing sensor histidine kinase [Daejeonella sp.]HQT58282.1 HAMP domain-containing sensor histidine kinase [Daejeonella sp.]